MKDSQERISYISDFITSYEWKIKKLNENGLFDAAKVFELFAQKLCEFWFKQKFENLNDTKPNYPYVDLISEDKTLYVQVSTTLDVPKKIQNTLEKIRDNKSKKFENINNLYFFVLQNDSIDKLKDFRGESKIGKIEFEKSKHLITTKQIISKSINDLEFQKQLYYFLKDESELLKQSMTKLNNAVKTSKSLICNVDHLINGEYEIDRSEIIKEIKDDNKQFISIQGCAGAGKTSLCKMLLKNEQLVLFARAEQFLEVGHLEDIWRIDISRVAEYLGEKRLFIYVDALEFIADALKSKFDLLIELYEIAKQNNNIYIITSCRSSDKNAFIKIENLYSIKAYEISALSDSQIMNIAKKYSIIQNLLDMNQNVELLKSPFYINLIVSKIKDYKCIKDITNFREYIWKNIICMGTTALPNGIRSKEIEEAVEKIAFDRAKKFMTGVKICDIGLQIVRLLKQEDIVTECQNDMVRLKYDIFEDIIFERFIDKKFDESRGDYNKFFGELEKLDRCIYRRYQIWIENKLFSKSKKDSFLYELIKTSNIPEDWKKQTMVGIVKSNFCSDFFDEYGDTLAEELVFEFARLINTYAYNVSIINLKYDNAYSFLNPIGEGRAYLIRIICENQMFYDEKNQNTIIKLCSDYSKLISFDDDIARDACRILEYYIDEEINQDLQKKHFQFDKIKGSLLAIYRMAKYSNEWIKEFWKNHSDYTNHESRNIDIDEKIIVFTLKNTVKPLVDFLPVELCEIANYYWRKEESGKKNKFGFIESPYKYRYESILPEKLKSYDYEFKKIEDNQFLMNLILFNWEFALDWIIDMSNYVTNVIKNKRPKEIKDFLIWEDDSNNKKKFLGNKSFWKTGIGVDSINKLLSDAIYIFQWIAVKKINNRNNALEDIKYFADCIKSEIMEKANNIMMLEIIAEIGIRCKEILPGYALPLTTNLDLIYYDMYIKFHVSYGLQSLDERYKDKKLGNESLKDYLIEIQFNESRYCTKAFAILDYLYSCFPNEGETVESNFQVQKMDMRKAKVNRLNDNRVLVMPKIEGNAKKVVEEFKNSKQNMNIVEEQNLIDQCNLFLKQETYDVINILNIIEQIQNRIAKAELDGLLQDSLIKLIENTLLKYKLDIKVRSDLCRTWICNIEGLFDYGLFYCKDYSIYKTLFCQIECELTDDVKKALKKLMLKLIFNKDVTGKSGSIVNYLKKYLVGNKILAKCLFNTIIGISEDEMALYKYNASKLNEIGMEIEYRPNFHQPPINVNDIFTENNINLYQSNREQIIKKYLFDESDKDMSTWSIDDCDIRTLCYVSNCGLRLDDKDFKNVIRQIFPYMINIISSVESYHKFLDLNSINEVETFIIDTLKSDEKKDRLYALKLLFDSPDFSLINRDVFKLYDNIAKYLLTLYFDGYNDKKTRKKCEEIIRCMEVKISAIQKENVKNRFYKMMFLTLESFYQSDWNKFTTQYSYTDKMFLNDIWSKYAWLYFEDFLYIIEQMQIKELMPEVLIPLNISLHKIKDSNEQWKYQVDNKKDIINMIITKAFLDFNDKIKLNDKLTNSFEELLSLLVDAGMEEAAVILDEFRIH